MGPAVVLNALEKRNIPETPSLWPTDNTQWPIPAISRGDIVGKDEKSKWEQHVP